jgi:hypothetical protein
LSFISLALLLAPPTDLVRTSQGCRGGGASGANGVLVDAQGVLRNEVYEDDPQLVRQRMMAARAKLGKQLGVANKFRKVSLNRLEAALRDRLDKRLGPTEEMLYLAGLTRVQYVFYYPETQDIVLAGPAEAWALDPAGRARGVDSGWTTLELQDLIVALRAYPPHKPGAQVMLVSIDPRPEGLAALNQFIAHVRRTAGPEDAPAIVDGMRASLGMQDIRVQGIAPRTHFAQVLIEADYRMKLIGLGMERTPVNLASYVDRANPSQISRNAMERWWFVPHYQCVRVLPDELGMQLVGNGVRLACEHEVVASNGARVVSKQGNKASELFVTGFTAKYAELASVVPVYAQLRNCVDLAIAAAFIQKHDYYGKAGWSMELFGNEQAYPVETLNTPRETETCVAGIWRGNTLMTPVGGGVELHPKKALDSENLLADDGGKVAKARNEVHIEKLTDKLAPGQWWWD